MASPSKALGLSCRAYLRRAATQGGRNVLARRYHSYDRPSTDPFSSAEQSILSAAYARVPEHGFSSSALALGARDAGYLDISTNLLPDGAFSLIRYHLVTHRQGLAPRAAQLFPADSKNALSTDDKVEALTWERLLSNQPIIHRWQEALATMAQPTHVPASFHELALLSDEIYHLAGDKAVDPSWYTQRGALSLIYASSELFMTNDRSSGFSDTREFLRRRFAETGSASAATGALRQWAGFTVSAGVNVLRSKGVRI